MRSISTVSVAVKALTIVFAATALYYQDLHMIFSNALVDDSSMYILVVPLLFAYLIYRKRKILRATISFDRPDLSRQTAHLATLSGFLLCLPPQSSTGTAPSPSHHWNTTS